MNARNVLTISLAGLMMVCGALAQDELSTAYNDLKAASEAKKPPAEIKKLAEVAFATAKKTLAPYRPTPTKMLGKPA